MKNISKGYMVSGTRVKIFLFTITVLLFSSTIHAKKITVGVGNFAPFFVKEKQSGLFLDLVKEMFKLMPDYEPKFVFMSNKRLMVEMENNKLDAACNIFKETTKKTYLSDPFFPYTDVGISFKKNNYKIKKMSDLKDKSIIAYQGATDLLGDEFEAMAKKNINYNEHPVPFMTTVKMIRMGVDVRIGDVFIFLHDLKTLRLEKKIKLSLSDFNIHYLWDDVYSYIAFKDKSVRDQANIAIKKIKKNGSYLAVYKRYESVFTQKKMLPPRKK